MNGEERWDIPFPDGTGDRLLAGYRSPANADDATGLPAIILIHGLSGCEDSRYVLNSARHLLECGYPVIRLNLRGAGPSQGLCNEYYHAGRSADLKYFFEQAARRLNGRALAAVGYSLGGNTLLKYLGEAGAGSRLAAAASVSAPIDLMAASRTFLKPRNRIYQHYIMHFLRRDALGGRTPPDAETARAVKQARTVYEFDQVFVAPRYGFEDADDYYRKSMALPFIPGIRTPTLIVHAKDDPWIPMDGYRDLKWRDLPQLTPRFPASGGHVGFHDAGSRVPWHDRTIAAFLAPTFGALNREA